MARTQSGTPTGERASPRHVGPADSNIADIVGPLWSEARVCSALAVTVDTLTHWRAVGDVLAVTTADGALLYPVFQFHRHPDRTVEVRPLLLPIFRAMSVFDGWTTAVLLHTPAPELADATPLDWLRDGGSPDAVVALAHVVAGEWDLRRRD